MKKLPRTRGAKPRQGERPAVVVVDPLTSSGGSRRTSPEISSLAAQVLNGYSPTEEEVRSMAASLLNQAETKGQTS